MTDAQETWLWIGTFGMAIGAVVIAALGRDARREDRHHFVASFFVCTLAACAYFAMANGQGITQIGDRTIYYARYVDWAVTTPLLLLGLVLVGLPAAARETSRERNTLVAGVLGADVLMIVTGLFATLTEDEAVRYTWFAISCGAFLAVVWLIFGPVMREARGQAGGATALYGRLTYTLAGLWFIYPVLWLLGTEGTGTIGLNTEVAIFALLDLSAKVGFGLLLVTGVKRLATSPSTEGAAAARPVRPQPA